MRVRFSIAGLVVVTLVVACAGEPVQFDPSDDPPVQLQEETVPTMPDNTIEPPEPTTTQPPISEEPPSTSAPAIPPAPGTLADQAVTDLASRLGLDPGQITVVSWEEVTWRDGSIGCPQPGMVYTQALVNGSKIVLEVDGVEYHYHQGGNRDLFLCEQPATQKSPPSTNLDL